MANIKTIIASIFVASAALLSSPGAHADKAALEAAKAAKEAAQRKAETGSFDLFTANASARNELNAYWLSYLTLLMYPENLGPMVGVDEATLQTSNAKFKSSFETRTSHFFAASTKFQFFGPTTTEGLNPEAMVIATDKTVIVLFRGTDKLANTAPGILGDILFEAGEWLITDANVLPLQKPSEGLRGKLHRGMKQSLDAVVDPISKAVLDNGGASKPVWLAGHSLGGAHAQIMGGYLKKRGANVKGVYVYNSPHPGDPDFAADLNATLGQSTIQRFEYLDDPIAMLPPRTSATTLLSGFPGPPGTPVGGFGRAGVRNYFSKLDGSNSFFSAAAERNEGTYDDVNLGRSGIFSPTSLCFHNPHWITSALFGNLSKANQEKLPNAPALHDHLLACNSVSMEMGRTGLTPLRQTEAEIAAAVGEVIETAAFNAAQIAANVAGTAIDEGDYFIHCNKGRKYLDISGNCSDENGCNAKLWDLGKSPANNRFHVRKEGPAYRITLKKNGKSLEVEGSERLLSGGRIQIWDSNSVGVVNANQKWFFYRVPGTRDRYVIVNAASFKVLDADNATANQNGGKVTIRNAVSNDQTQVWWLEKDN